MIIAAAQMHSHPKDIVYNIEKHIHFINQAAIKQTDVIIFPELSLTGYETSLSKDIILKPNDARLEHFQALSTKHSMVIGLGLPSETKAGIHISMVFFQPKKKRQFYSKQFLHEDELPYFNPGDSQLILKLKGEVIIPAICFESLVDAHEAIAQKSKATIYLASVAKPQKAIEKAYLHYPKIANRNKMNVVVANSIGATDTFISAGQSGAWNAKGELISNMSNKEEGLLVIEI